MYLKIHSQKKLPRNVPAVPLNNIDSMKFLDENVEAINPNCCVVVNTFAIDARTLVPLKYNIKLSITIGNTGTGDTTTGVRGAIFSIYIGLYINYLFD